MKKPFVILAFFFLWIFSCKTKEDIELNPTGLVGKWVDSGRVQSQNADGTWSYWYVLETFAAVPVSIWEFTSDGRFLKDGKDGGTCCSAGNKYVVAGQYITFGAFAPPCANVLCKSCVDWTFNLSDKDTLVLEECSNRKEFYRMK